jgi:CRP/FNR family transcriptional regulator, cyclic AMP receptor protein
MWLTALWHGQWWNVLERGHSSSSLEVVMESLIADAPRSAGVNAVQMAMPRPRPSDGGVKTRVEEKQGFDAQRFLDAAGVRKKVSKYEGKEIVFSQGDPATSILYIQKGSVKLTVVNEAGKEAVVAILGPGDFLGEGCLAGQPQRVNTAGTITPATLVVIEKQEIIRELQADRALSDQFIKHLLSRDVRAEEDLIDQLFNHVEKRLARTLLLLAHYGEPGQAQKAIPDVSQEVLAEMIGTTRSRVNLFLNKFRKLGFISYGSRLSGLEIHDSLLSIVLEDWGFEFWENCDVPNLWIWGESSPGLAGIHGDKQAGIQQLEIAAERGHYLRPFVKILLALAALREKTTEVARAQLTELAAEFPENPLFSTELSKLKARPVPTVRPKNWISPEMNLPRQPCAPCRPFGMLSHRNLAF